MTEVAKRRHFEKMKKMEELDKNAENVAKQKLVDKMKKMEELDKNAENVAKQKLCDQLTRWHHRVVHIFRNKDEREIAEFLDELEENMPARIAEIGKCLQTFLENGSDFPETYIVFQNAHDMTLGIGSASKTEGMDADHILRLKTLLVQLEARHLQESRWSVNIIQFLRIWSADLEKWTTDNGTVADLEDILKSFEDLDKTAYIWPGILEKIMIIHQKCAEEGWPAILVDIFQFMVKAIQLFDTRLGETQASLAVIGESRRLAERLSKMRSRLTEILDTEIMVKDLVVFDLFKKTDEDIPLKSTEQRETDIYCFTKRAVERAKDLLIKGSISTEILDLNDETEERLVKEVDGKVKVAISHDVPKSYKSYRIHLKTGEEWIRLAASLQNDQPCVTTEMPPKTMLFFTSMENDTQTKLVPDQEYIHVCPENCNVCVEFSEGSVTTSQDIHIRLQRCRFPLTEIAGYSDIVSIQHREEFLKPVTVTMPMTMIGDNDIADCDLYCVHIGDDGLSINEDVKVEKLNGNMCRFETITFGKNVLHARKKMKKLMGKLSIRDLFTKQLQQLHDSEPHRIILYICKRLDEDTWRFHAEVVSQTALDDNIEKRRKEMALYELNTCRSPSLLISGIHKINILGDNCSVSRWKGAPSGDVTINIIREGNDNYIQFVAMVTSKEKRITVLFQATGSSEIMHSASIHQDDIDRYNRFITSQTDDSLRMPISKLQSEVVALAPSMSVDDNNITSAYRDTPISSMASVKPNTETVHENFFGDMSLLTLIKQIPTNTMWELGIYVGLSTIELEDLKQRHGKTDQFRLSVIRHWLRNRTGSEQEMVSELCNALEEVNLGRIAEIVQSVFKENRPLEKTDF